MSIFYVNPWSNLRAECPCYALFLFSYKNIAFPAEAEYSYFSADNRLQIFLGVFLDYSVWQLFGVWMVYMLD